MFVPLRSKDRPANFISTNRSVISQIGILLFILRNNIDCFLNTVEALFQILNHSFGLKKIILTVLHDDFSFK